MMLLNIVFGAILGCALVHGTKATEYEKSIAEEDDIFTGRKYQFLLGFSELTADCDWATKATECEKPIAAAKNTIEQTKFQLAFNVLTADCDLNKNRTNGEQMGRKSDPAKHDAANNADELPVTEPPSPDPKDQSVIDYKPTRLSNMEFAIQYLYTDGKNRTLNIVFTSGFKTTITLTLDQTFDVPIVREQVETKLKNHYGGKPNEQVLIQEDLKEFDEELVPRLKMESKKTFYGTLGKNPAAIQIQFPNTTWCDRKKAASNDDNLGAFTETDACCQAHDKCPLSIEVGQTCQRLSNFAVFERFHCSCESEFYKCLKAVNDSTSLAIGETYFNLAQPQCIDYVYKEISMSNILYERRAYPTCTSTRPLEQLTWYNAQRF